MGTALRVDVALASGQHQGGSKDYGFGEMGQATLRGSGNYILQFLVVLLFDANSKTGWPAIGRPADKMAMKGLGDRLRTRARELGWSDAEVARRVGLSQGRYANYVTDRYEPDLAMLLRICSALGMSLEGLLGLAAPPDDESADLRQRIASAATALDVNSLRVASILIDALVARSASLTATKEESASPRAPQPKPVQPRPRARAP